MDREPPRGLSLVDDRSAERRPDPADARGVRDRRPPLPHHPRRTAPQRLAATSFAALGLRASGRLPGRVLSLRRGGARRCCLGDHRRRAADGAGSQVGRDRDLSRAVARVLANRSTSRALGRRRVRRHGGANCRSGSVVVGRFAGIDRVGDGDERRRRHGAADRAAISRRGRAEGEPARRGGRGRAGGALALH